MTRYCVQDSVNILGKEVFYIASYRTFLSLRYTDYKRESTDYFDKKEATEALETFFIKLYVGT